MDFGDFLREASQEMEFSEGTLRVLRVVTAPCTRHAHVLRTSHLAYAASVTLHRVTERSSRACRPPVSHRRGLLMSI